MAGKILVVEDERPTARSLWFLLTREGYEVALAYDGETALRMMEQEKPDLVLLDIMLPDLSGTEVCRRVREQRRYMPIIMLTAKAEEVDKVLGLEMGADDYVTKPFQPRELIARIQAQLRRALIYSRPQSQQQRQVQIGLLTVDADTREVRLGQHLIPMTPKEFDLLYTLALHAGRVISREVLLEEVWGETRYLNRRTLDVHIRRLRVKLEPNPSQPRYIQTIPGVGYKLNREHLMANGASSRPEKSLSHP